MSTSTISVVSVGEPHPLWLPGLVNTTVISPSCSHWMFSLADVTESDIDDFQSTGRAGFLTFRNLVVLVVDWSFLQVTIPYHDNIIGESEQFEETENGVHRLMTFALVDSLSGKTIGLRAATLSRHVSAQLQRQFDSQRQSPILPGDLVEAATSFNSQGYTWREISKRATMCRLGD